MNQKRIMLIAGETSGDMLAAELVKAMKAEALQRPIKTDLYFFGAGGPKMAEAGVELAVDMTAHAVIGLVEVLKNYRRFKKLFDQLLQLAIEQKPDVIVCVDFSGFNRRFAHAVKNHVRANQSSEWNPKVVQFVSPQVWASRPGRADKMAKDFDLLLCIFPFEKEWYSKRVPDLRVEFVGHPIMDRYVGFTDDDSRFTPESANDASIVDRKRQILLLPGSRAGELERHLPVMIEAARNISLKHAASFKIVLPHEKLKQLTVGPAAFLPGVEIQIGGLAEALTQASVAIASTGTVLMECAYFGVPTVAMYKTSWSTYQIGKRIIQVKFLAMPNLLANEVIYPELIQHDATAESVAREAIELLTGPERCAQIKTKLAKVVQSLGGAGASRRAAQSIARFLS